jgi:excisionase family DNA binding protein
MKVRKQRRQELSKVAERRESLTTAEAAALTGYAQDYIGLMIRKGVLQAHKRGRDWFVEADSLLRHVVSNPRPGRKGIN